MTDAINCLVGIVRQMKENTCCIERVQTTKGQFRKKKGEKNQKELKYLRTILPPKSAPIFRNHREVVYTYILAIGS